VALATWWPTATCAMIAALSGWTVFLAQNSFDMKNPDAGFS
jgi:hypothetical protein